MAIYRSSNPALNDNVFTESMTGMETETMTISGTVNKTFLLGLIVFGGALFTWYQVENGNMALAQPIMIGGAILGFITAMVIIFKKTWAGFLAPVYCAFQGVFLGGISAFMEMTYPGIVIQAILLTFTILFSLLLIYRTGVIKVTENFKLMVAAATMGIALVYLVSFIGSFFNFNIPMIHSNGTFGILFSLAVIAIASLNLVVDFDFIERGEEVGAPKYMEWYAAFGLMVTLIWLYLEILRLLAKLRSR